MGYFLSSAVNLCQDQWESMEVKVSKEYFCPDKRKAKLNTCPFILTSPPVRFAQVQQSLIQY